MSDYSFDLGGLLGTQATKTVKNSTNRKAGYGLDMDDFLKLMVAQLQNQSIDDTADTSEMMNQMVQMSVIQAISNISTLVSDSTNLTYAVSLVGKEVTIGQRIGGEIVELVGTVTGTGTLNGRQVIFLDDDETPYYLTDIMAVGRLPDIKGDKTESEETGETEEEEEEELEAVTLPNTENPPKTELPAGALEKAASARDPHVPDEDGALG